MYLTIILTAIAVSLDSVVAGFSYGVSKIIIPKKSLVILSLIPVFMTFSVMYLSGILADFLTGNFIKFFGFFTMISLAVFSFKQYLNSKKTIDINETLSVSDVFKNPNLADIDGTQDISAKESVVLGLAIGLDACTASVVLAFYGANIMSTSCVIGIMNFLFLEIGNLLGKKVKIKTEFLRLISVIIFILLAFLKLV